MSDQTDQKDQEKPETEAAPPAKDPVRKWTFIILVFPDLFGRSGRTYSLILSF